MSVDKIDVKLTGWNRFDKVLIEAQDVINDYEMLKDKVESTQSSFNPKPISFFNINLKMKRPR